MLLKEKVHKALQFIRTENVSEPKIAIILGSGLGGFAESLDNTVIIPTKDIPFYPVSTVPGHKGQWIFGDINGTSVLAVQGRVHYYEGYSLEQVTFPVHLFAGLGIKTLIVTTASGGLNPEFKPGDLMLITDHINFAFGNPLIGRPENLLGPRFPDMSEPYNKELLDIAINSGKETGIPLRQGVFCWVTGPNYETAAEVRMLQKCGGDAVSMSTVPEVIVANQRHLRVLGISLITNLSTGLSDSKLHHKEVTDMANKAGVKLQKLLKTIILKIKD